MFDDAHQLTWVSSDGITRTLSGWYPKYNTSWFWSLAPARRTQVLNGLRAINCTADGNSTKNNTDISLYYAAGNNTENTRMILGYAHSWTDTEQLGYKSKFHLAKGDSSGNNAWASYGVHETGRSPERGYTRNMKVAVSDVWAWTLNSSIQVFDPFRAVLQRIYDDSALEFRITWQAKYTCYNGYNNIYKAETTEDMTSIRGQNEWVELYFDHNFPTSGYVYFQQSSGYVEIKDGSAWKRLADLAWEVGDSPARTPAMNKKQDYYAEGYGQVVKVHPLSN
jgi:hypothetical protein